jgi:hypothetical protein
MAGSKSKTTLPEGNPPSYGGPVLSASLGTIEEWNIYLREMLTPFLDSLQRASHDRAACFPHDLLSERSPFLRGLYDAADAYQESLFIKEVLCVGHDVTKQPLNASIKAITSSKNALNKIPENMRRALLRRHAESDKARGLINEIAIEHRHDLIKIVGAALDILAQRLENYVPVNTKLGREPLTEQHILICSVAKAVEQALDIRMPRSYKFIDGPKGSFDRPELEFAYQIVRSIEPATQGRAQVVTALRSQLAVKE